MAIRLEGPTTLRLVVPVESWTSTMTRDAAARITVAGVAME
jgi:hypothetical protein